MNIDALIQALTRVKNDPQMCGFVEFIETTDVCVCTLLKSLVKDTDKFCKATQRVPKGTFEYIIFSQSYAELEDKSTDEIRSLLDRVNDVNRFLWQDLPFCQDILKNKELWPRIDYTQPYQQILKRARTDISESLAWYVVQKTLDYFSSISLPKYSYSKRVVRGAEQLFQIHFSHYTVSQGVSLGVSQSESLSNDFETVYNNIHREMWNLIPALHVDGQMPISHCVDALIYQLKQVLNQPPVEQEQ